jgi:hypothetical protein
MEPGTVVEHLALMFRIRARASTSRQAWSGRRDRLATRAASRASCRFAGAPRPSRRGPAAARRPRRQLGVLDRFGLATGGQLDDEALAPVEVHRMRVRALGDVSAPGRRRASGTGRSRARPAGADRRPRTRTRPRRRTGARDRGALGAGWAPAEVVEDHRAGRRR